MTAILVDTHASKDGACAMCHKPLPKFTPIWYTDGEMYCKSNDCLPKDLILDENDWQMALHAQDASNLSGLAHALSNVITKIRNSTAFGTIGINNHPIVRLYVAQMLHLCSNGQSMNFDLWEQAYKVAQQCPPRHI